MTIYRPETSVSGEEYAHYFNRPVSGAESTASSVSHYTDEAVDSRQSAAAHVRELLQDRFDSSYQDKAPADFQQVDF